MSAAAQRPRAARMPAGRPAAPGGRDLAAELLAWVTDHADVLTLVPAAPGRPKRLRWLLVPVRESLLQALELVGADLEDLELDADGEPETDDEDGGEDERADVRPDAMGRTGLPNSGPELQITAGQRRRYSVSSDRRTLQQAKDFIRAHEEVRP